MALRHRWIAGLACFVIFQVVLFFTVLRPKSDAMLSNHLLTDKDAERLFHKDTYFIAALLHDSEHILRHLILRLPQLVQTLGPSRVYVSILDSGSTDRSSALISKLSSVLDDVGVGGHSLISLVDGRPPGSDRIEFLSSARNEVLVPLQGWFKAKGPGKLLFFNDIVWEVTDILDLLLTNGTEYDMACGLDFYYSFYDVWVTRDMNGDPFVSNYPYTRRAEDQIAVKMMRSFPVYSCWNGVVSMRSEPFINHTLAFRTAAEGECPASECFLVCTDMRRLGYRRIMLNPRVRVAYTVSYYDLHHIIMPWINPIIGYFSRAKPSGRYPSGLDVRFGPTETACGLE